MTLADAVNGCFESLGALFVLNNCRALVRDKRVCGVSLLSSGFFSAWGGWNLYFYPSLGQWLSFAGGVGLVAGNVLWLALAIWFSRVTRES